MHNYFQKLLQIFFKVCYSNSHASFVFRVTKLSVTLPDIECEDGTTISPLSVTFSEGCGRSDFFEGVDEDGDDDIIDDEDVYKEKN